ncbi:MAG: hypothetical protein Q8R70_13360, partial [Methanoregula sp.]|nr:hypothetical protein [Methanoregula sp.]
SAAFVNGEILSYPNSNDISLQVTVDGFVPQAQSDQVMLLQVEEIDNTGNIVPGSVITLSQPVAGQPATAAQTIIPTHTPPVITPSPLPTKASGFTTVTGMLAFGLVLIFAARRDG